MIVQVSADSRYPVNRKFLRKTVIDFLDGYGFSDRKVLAEISVVGNRKIKDLNFKYRQLNEPTDVLSFPLEDSRSGPDGLVRLGDVVVSYPEAMTQAILTNRVIDKTIADLIIHGIKHLLGEHHE